MTKFYCEYCDIYLTHSSPAGRRQHTTGRKHINAKVEYYQNLARTLGLQALQHDLRGPRPPVPVSAPTIIRPQVMIRPPVMPNSSLPTQQPLHEPHNSSGIPPPIILGRPPAPPPPSSL